MLQVCDRSRLGANGSHLMAQFTGPLSGGDIYNSIRCAACRAVPDMPPKSLTRLAPNVHAVSAPTRRGERRGRDLPQRTCPWRVTTKSTPSKRSSGLPPGSVPSSARGTKAMTAGDYRLRRKPAVASDVASIGGRIGYGLSGHCRDGDGPKSSSLNRTSPVFGLTRCSDRHAAHVTVT
jgi:hypothetical protein